MMSAVVKTHNEYRKDFDCNLVKTTFSFRVARARFPACLIGRVFSKNSSNSILAVDTLKDTQLAGWGYHVQWYPICSDYYVVAGARQLIQLIFFLVFGFGMRMYYCCCYANVDACQRFVRGRAFPNIGYFEFAVLVDVDFSNLLILLKNENQASNFRQFINYFAANDVWVVVRFVPNNLFACRCLASAVNVGA